MRICPFCRKTVKAVYPDIHYLEEKKIHIFTHFCDTNEPLSVCVTVVGKTEEEVIAKWNGDIDV
jgi:hypothetical protein